MSDPLEFGLPANLDAERFVLGSILNDETAYLQTTVLAPDDFSLEKHRRIFLRMGNLHNRSESIDRVTLANELRRHGQLESCDGITYLCSLDDGMPRLQNFDGYVRLVQEAGARRRIIFNSQRTIERCLLGADDATEIAKDAAHGLLGAAATKDTSKLQTAYSILEDHGGVQGIGASNNRGIQTGFTRLDGMTGGFQRGDLVIIAARPSMGKSALALNMAAHMALGRDRLKVAFFSLEMSKASLLNRLLCSMARVDLSKSAAGYLNGEERRKLQTAANSLKDIWLNIDDSHALSPVDIHAKLRRMQIEQGVDIAFIDYLQFMNVPEGKRKSSTRDQDIGNATRYLKQMIAKEMNIPVVLLSQLSRASETRSGDHRPQLSDLRESGNIEQDADVIAFVYREEVYKQDREDLRGLAELLLSKQRNGPTGTIKLVWLREFTKFENRCQDIGEEAGVA